MSLITTVDYHTGGEPFRIVTGGVPPIEGRTVLERRERARGAPFDEVRRMLCHEPRGHADMYGCFVVPPDDAGAALGVLFWHKDGYSTACGHGTIALATWAVESGLLEAAPDGVTEVAIDVPSGRVVARVACRGGAVEAVVFVSVPAFVMARGWPVETSRGRVLVDVAWGGAIYASVEAAALGVSATAGNVAELIVLGREIKHALAGSEVARHPSEPRLDGVYGTIFWDALGDGPVELHQRNVTVFADGEVDRSPCGSGTAARMALLADEGRMREGRILVHESCVGSVFRAWIEARVEPCSGTGGRPAVVPAIEGCAFKTGEHRFVRDPRDAIGLGFVLR